VLLVVAHPDEFVFVAKIWGIAKERKGTIDQFVITGWAGGNRYSALDERCCSANFADDFNGETSLPEIRRHEMLPRTWCSASGIVIS